MFLLSALSLPTVSLLEMVSGERSCHPMEPILAFPVYLHPPNCPQCHVEGTAIHQQLEPGQPCEWKSMMLGAWIASSSATMGNDKKKK